MLFDDVNETEEEGRISGGVVFPLSAEEESLLFFPFDAVIFFFFEFVLLLLLLLIDVIEEEPESDELAVENKFVEGDPEEEVEEDE